MARWMLNLQEIGDELDRGANPRVGNRGIVMPSEVAESSTTMYEEQEHGRSAARRPEAGSGERSPGREGETGGQGTSKRQRSSDASPSDFVAGASVRYEAELDDIQLAYPGVRVWRQEGGFWLLTEAALLPGLRQRAVFLTGISPQKNVVKSWGFWRYGCLAHQWIGPRHTNFPDGSVCAFEPRDGTWVIGDPIVELLDLYSLWALRHLYLKVFGRWPGPQAVMYVYERIAEMREDELCGCGRSRKRYGECCAQSDRSQDQIRVAVNFLARLDLDRRPPPPIVDVICDRSTPPQLTQFFDEIGYHRLAVPG